MNAVSSRSGLMALWVAALLGCQGTPTGDGLAHEPVSGTVTLDGKPLDGASIQFIPVADQAASETSGEVKDGKFAIGADRGPVAGSYKVVISSQSGDEVQPGELPGEPTKPRRDPIPAKYNTKTGLTAEVKAGGPNEFDFPLKGR